MGKMLQSSINDNRFFLQWLAILSMTIDHIGFFLFPDLVFLRVIGRFACPIYMFLAVQSYYYTSSKGFYFFRLLFLGLISQVPYMCLVSGHVNMILSMLLCFIAFILYDRHRFFMSFSLVTLLSFLPLDYPAWFIFCSFVIFSGRSHLKMAVLFTILSMVLSVVNRNDIFSFHILFVILFFVPYVPVPRIPVILWRWFYPLHLAVFVFFVILLNYLKQ